MVAPETIQLLAVSPAAEVSTIDIPAKIAEATKHCQRWHIYKGVDGYEQFLTDSRDVGRTLGCALVWDVPIPSESDVTL